RFLLCARNRALGRVRRLFGRAHRSAPDAKVWAATFSIAPPLRLRVDAGWLAFRAPDRYPTRAAQRTIATAMRVHTGVRSWRGLPREYMRLPASNFQQSDFCSAHRAPPRQTTRLETCAAVSPAANGHGLMNASRNSHKMRA